MPGLGNDLGDGVTAVAQMPGVVEFVGAEHDRPADPPPLRFGDGAGVRCTFRGVGALHLTEQRQQHHRQLHRRILPGGVNPDWVGEVPYSDARSASS
jgi:hypothetical protein